MATVIKAGESGTVARRLTTVDLADHLREAQSVIADARARSAQMIRDARREAEHVREQARVEGHRTGYAEGVAQGRSEGLQEARERALAEFKEQQDSLARTLISAIQAFETMKEDLEIAARRDVLELAVELARHLTFALGRLHRESAVENLRRAVARVGRRTNLTVRVNAADQEAMEQFAPALAAQWREAGHVTVETDDAIAPGGCRVHTAETDVDATLETQLEATVHLLLGKRVAGEPLGHEGAADA